MTDHLCRCAVTFAIALLPSAARPAAAQLGMLTSAVGSGHIEREGSAAPWVVGETVDQEDRIITAEQSYAMVFFVSGLGAEDIDFAGTIVVELDEQTTVEIRRGRGRRPPINVHVLSGRIRAFFDAGEHKDYIVLSTPLAELQVTGSVVFAAHNADGSELGSYDSDCVVRVADSDDRHIARFEKVVVRADGTADIEGVTIADTERWEEIPDLMFASAAAHRREVRTAYAESTWVGEYVTGSQRLENVTQEIDFNIPDQVPEVAAVTPVAAAANVVIRSNEQNPRLRSTGGGRSVGGSDDGIGRETLQVDAPGTPRATRGPLLGAGGAGLSSGRSRSVSPAAGPVRAARINR